MGEGPVNKEFIDYFNKSDLSFLPKKKVDMEILVD